MNCFRELKIESGKLKVKTKTMAELTWKEAIIKVLEEEKKALHYTDIAELIAERGYRKSLGATPQDTVSANLTTDINANKEKSIYAKVDRGIYILRKFLDDKTQLLSDENPKEKTVKKKAQKAGCKARAGEL